MSLTRAIAAIAAAVFCLPVVATWHPAVPIRFRIVTAALLIGTLFRPLWGVLVVAGLLPLGMLIAAGASAPFNAAEALEILVAPVVLATALRTVAQPRRTAETPLLWPAAVMASLVVATLVVQLVEYREPGSQFGPWFGDFWRHLSWKYFVEGPLYPPLHRAFMWLAGLALAVSVATLTGEPERSRVALARMAVFGAAAAGLYAIIRVAEFALRSPNPWGAVEYAFGTLRISPHMEPNAAGSFYVLFAVPVVFWILSRRAWWSLIAVVPLITALWLTRSRTALLAWLTGVAIAWMLARGWSWRRFAILSGMAALILSVLIGLRFGREEPALPSAWFRVDMARVSLQLAARSPIFGLGLDTFHAASVPLITPEIAATFPAAARGENAHNNFLQILVELGAAGLMAFFWLLTVAALPLVRAVRQGHVGFLPLGIGAGVFAFLITCVMGHPLLVSEAALPFFLMLGLVAAAVPNSAAGTPRAPRIAAACVLIVAIALVLRLASRI